MRATPVLRNRLVNLIAVTGAALLCASAARAADRVAKLNLMIPPGHSQLDDLQKDYENTSKELEAAFAAVQKNAPACTNGAQLAKLVAKGVPWMKSQREKVLKALNKSTADLQTEVAKLDQVAAEESGNLTIVSASKGIIAKGITDPKAVIQKELPPAQTFSLRLRVTNDAAAQLLAGDAAGCARARQAYFAKMRPQADALPEKLKKLVSALEDHRVALDSYADSVSNTGRKPAGRAPASK